jgi:hypothetical protein
MAVNSFYDAILHDLIAPRATDGRQRGKHRREIKQRAPMLFRSFGGSDLIGTEQSPSISQSDAVPEIGRG